MKSQNPINQSINGDIRSLLQLSCREGEVLLLIADGYTNREIAEQLYLSVRTVETHEYHIYEKLDLHSRQALIEWIRHIDG